MGSQAVLLVRKPPKFSSDGGMFFVDFGVDGVPTIAVSPAVMLKSIGAARLEYERWASDAGDVVRTG